MTDPTPPEPRPAPVAALEHALQEIKPRSHWPMFLLALSIVLVALTMLVVVSVVGDNRRALKANQESVRVSCTLLTNAILESGAGASPRDSPAARPTPQQRLTAIYIQVISRNMTADERREARRIAGEQTDGAVTVPDCDKIAERPQTVTAIPQK